MILVTGGCGYIGSHCVIELLKKGHNILVIDNLSNSSENVIEKIKKITNSNFKFAIGDLRDRAFIINILKDYNIKNVLHFAGLKSVSESLKNPDKYFQNNVLGTKNLIDAMLDNQIKSIIFSSSATVYSNHHRVPWFEGLKLDIPATPYGQTKYLNERMLKFCSAEYGFRVGVLRYFNPIGFHDSGIIGEFHNSSNNFNTFDNNLIPAIVDVFLGRKANLLIYGNDYKTKDGTGIRDYIHINDLIRGHLKAMKYIDEKNGYHIWNLGSGRGYSVMELINRFNNISERKIGFEIVKRRDGDIAEYWADIAKAKEELNWEPEKCLDDMLKDVINYINNNSLK